VCRLKASVGCAFVAVVVWMPVPAASCERQAGTPGDVREDQAKMQEKADMGKEGGRLSWGSPRILALERRLKAEGVMSQGFSRQELHDLAASCATMPVNEEDWTDFASLLIRQMFYGFLSSGDREGLVTLLSGRCPREIAHAYDVEYYLVDEGKKLKDPILVLGEAYAKCKVPEVRGEIAAAVRRAFWGSGVRGKNKDETVAKSDWFKKPKYRGEEDDQYVKNAMQWYERNKDQLDLNRDYEDNVGNAVSIGDYDENPLFKRKAPSKPTPLTPNR
jgi:hypothetical protein